MKQDDELPGSFAFLPEHLQYLCPFALRYALSVEQNVFAAIARLSPEENEELACLAEKVWLNEHYTDVNAFLDQYKLYDYRESAYLYFLFGMLDYLDLQFD
jgi:hypothetical protein